MRGEGLEGELYRRLVDIGEANRQEVVSRFPRIMRRVGGYNLDEFVNGDGFDMARFVVGSEGTLVVITEAKLRLVPKPKLKALAVLHFRELIESMEAAVAVLELEPAAVEMMDGMTIRPARNNLKYSRMMDFIEGDPESLLIVELTGESESELDSRLDRLEERIARSGLGYAVKRFTKPEEQAKVWAFRKASLGLLMNVRGDAKPLPFVEDTAVDPQVLPEYVRRFDQIVREHGTTAGYYGHASVGSLHIRPLIDLKLQQGVEQMVSIADSISDLVLEFGGAMSGEHGDGLARSVWNEKMFGPQLYNAFREVKRAFDPKGIMNPGKIVDPPPMTENLRISPAYHTLDIETAFAFTEEGSLAGAIEMCNGQGACRKVLEGTMCPSYMATRDEEHSTRGRANALRAAISGTLPVDALTGERLYQVMDLCLACKGCKAECPSSVDMAKLKYEFLDRYHKANGYPLRDRFFANISGLSRLGAFFAPLSNWVLRSQLFKQLMERMVGIDARRDLPPFASRTFSQWFRARGDVQPETATRGKVLLFPDTFTNYNHPDVGIAATLVLERLGYEVVVPSVKCCGRPMLSRGMVDKAKKNARFNVDSVFPHVEQGAKLVGVEPGCILTFRDDYVDLLGGDSKARAVAESTMLVEEFVLYALREEGAHLELAGGPTKVLYHGHCHQKAIVGTGPALELLRSIRGCDVREVPSGCCGMAGSFGYEKEHYDISMSVGEQILFPAIRSQQGDFVVVSDGVSCRQQIEHATGRRTKHLVEVLAEAL